MTSGIQGVVQFILERWPASRTPLRGASKDEIHRLEEVQGRTLPEAYKTFLTHVGHGSDGLAWEHIDFRPSAIERFVTRSRRLSLVPRRYILVGRDLTESELEYFLDLGVDSGNGPPAVRVPVINLEDKLEPESERIHPDATSLAEMLFREAYHDLRVEPMQHMSLHSDVRGENPPKERAEQVLTELGLIRHPLSGPWVQGYESDEGVIEVRWLKGEGLQLIAASDHEEWISKVGKELRSRLPVVLI
ncbi:hypothetical protein CYFUS_003810 [Cystobacter fuscus]|uniref:Knr4/Smi1-like domain-containing protein n=1 Tax=Cystobacter fuscus TaxID=43 RepID=A0A250J5C9_9BACT|nr:SMI1/KNR4 family protein [Cystobacter fuscus]ATB38376.1 hypothetical protein CYFUS_003810 [Cystobacter fuscus]